jgi:hypothetical protein
MGVQMTAQAARLVLIDDVLWILTANIGLRVYDFAFETPLPCSHPWKRPDRITAVARIGAFEDYESQYKRLRQEGVELIHTPERHLRCSQLPHWYPLLQDLTPRSRWYDRIPAASEVVAEFGWPVFVKGARQTSRHQKALSIIGNAEEFERAMESYRNDPILHWQSMVCREYIRLRPVNEPLTGKIPPSFEFRTFWWKGNLVGIGPYWWEAKPYRMSHEEQRNALAVAAQVARRLEVPFLVVDLAQTTEGRWIVIECNDGQESGYAGCSQIGIWQNITAFEKRATGL